MRVLSADWVLPVEGEPIERGAVAIEDGVIAAVGTAAELGEGERFPDSAIVPGFVNAHTHLEAGVDRVFEAEKLGWVVMVWTACWPPCGWDTISSRSRDHTGLVALLFKTEYKAPVAGNGCT